MTSRELLQEYLNMCVEFRCADPFLAKMGIINDFFDFDTASDIDGIKSHLDRVKKCEELRKAAGLAILEEQDEEEQAVLCDIYLKATYDKDPDDYENKYQRIRAHRVLIQILEAMLYSNEEERRKLIETARSERRTKR